MTYPGEFDWSVCLLTLKHLVSLQARTRTSVVAAEAELDLRTTMDQFDKLWVIYTHNRSVTGIHKSQEKSPRISIGGGGGSQEEQ